MNHCLILISFFHRSYALKIVTIQNVVSTPLVILKFFAYFCNHIYWEIILYILKACLKDKFLSWWYLLIINKYFLSNYNNCQKHTKSEERQDYMMENREWRCSIENNTTCTWLALNMKKSASRAYMVHTR